MPGADDFLAKPVRLDELIARVRAHLRTQAAWSGILQEELRVRSGVVAALGALTLSTVPEETAEAVVTELSARTDSDFVSVAQVTGAGHMQELATFNRRDGVRRGGDVFPLDLATYLLGRARGGPWVDVVRSAGPAEPTASLAAANLELVANAPIFAGDALVGLLTIGVAPDDTQQSSSRQAKLLAAAIDYASVLNAVAGPAIAGRRDAAELRTRLESVLESRAFHPVFQPIVEVETGVIVGFEALTRFDDGVRPDVRFAEADGAGLAALLRDRRRDDGARGSVRIAPRRVPLGERLAAYGHRADARAPRRPCRHRPLGRHRADGARADRRLHRPARGPGAARARTPRWPSTTPVPDTPACATSWSCGRRTPRST